jgi:hypothetical protein
MVAIRDNQPYYCDGWKIAICQHCIEPSIWLNQVMIYPSTGNAPAPNADLSEDVANDYLEARSILSLSPRGAAALLRLAVQKLCIELGEKGRDLNADIASLVRKGLLPQVQQALDAVRVVGNNAVHPGEINLQDNVAVAGMLFQLVNLIAEQLISTPKRVAAVFQELPASNLAAIAKRDGAPRE